ncbi:MAG: hypothetical protein WCA46_14705 [Actinocatenispora sp.]
MGPLIAAFIVLAAAVGFLRSRRQRRGRDARVDAPAVVVEWAAGLLSVDRAEWGQAMVGELEQYQGSARWRFALGCVVAALGLPRRGRDGQWVVVPVLAAAAASAGLVGYGFLRYPGMVLGAGTWLALTAFAVVLVGFVVVTSMTVRRSPIGVTGLICGCVLAGVWIVVAVLTVSARSTAPMYLLLILPLVSIAVGVVGVRRGRTPAAGRRTALVSSVVAALVVFLVVATDTLVTGGRPYDAGQLHDFATSRYADMATYAVSDDLGTAMVLLVLVSVVTAVLGSVGAALAVRRGQR